MPASQKMSNLFDQIDNSGSGSITQAQFDQAFQTLNPPKDFKAAGADAIWSQLDPSNTGSVSRQELRQHNDRNHASDARGTSSRCQRLGAFVNSISRTNNFGKRIVAAKSDQWQPTRHHRLIS